MLGCSEFVIKCCVVSVASGVESCRVVSCQVECVIKCCVALHYVECVIKCCVVGSVRSSSMTTLSFRGSLTWNLSLCKVSQRLKVSLTVCVQTLKVSLTVCVQTLKVSLAVCVQSQL